MIQKADTDDALGGAIEAGKDRGLSKVVRRFPKDIRHAYAQVYGQRWEAIFWAPADTAPERAKLLYVEWLQRLSVG